MTARHEAVGGTLWTPGMKWLLGLAAVGGALLAWRFAVGLGAPTALTDGYPWGLWIAFDVVTGTALGCGGYAIALLVYVLNRGRYHPLMRPALLTSALGYTLGAFGVIIDIGRYWHVWKLPVSFWEWNLSSILLEVALCIMLYTFLLWIEVSPAFLERWRDSSRDGLRNFAQKATPVLRKGMLPLLALGLLLPTMHQSSLGSLMLLAGPKLHPLWHTGYLPLLFLLSCASMGYGVVIMESALATRVFGRERDTEMLAALGRPMVVVLLGYAVIRLLDLMGAEKLGYVFALDGHALLFWLEMALFLLPAWILLREERRRDLGRLFRVAMLVVLGGALYRFSTYLVAFDPGGEWTYFPAVPEILITVGLVAAEVAAYIAIVKRFPILSGPAPAET